MKDLYNYIFYRIALFYEKHLPFENSVSQGHVIELLSISFYVLSLFTIILSSFEYKLTKTWIIIIGIPYGLCIIFMDKIFPNSDKLFEKLSQKYAEERCKWIKGSLVFLFVVFSIVCYIACLIFFVKS